MTSNGCWTQCRYCNEVSECWRSKSNLDNRRLFQDKLMMLCRVPYSNKISSSLMKGLNLIQIKFSFITLICNFMTFPVSRSTRQVWAYLWIEFYQKEAIIHGFVARIDHSLMVCSNNNSQKSSAWFPFTTSLTENLFHISNYKINFCCNNSNT